MRHAPLVLSLLLAGTAVSAQTRSVSGSVEVAREGGRTEPVPGVWVTLHRVGVEGGAPLDSMRTGPRGAYQFRFTPRGDTTALYFATAMFRDIAYFAGPFRSLRTTGDDALIVVFDTTSAARPSVSARHIVIAAPGAGGAREVIELYELENAGSRTIVASRERATFESPLPEGAREPQPSGGDVAREAMTFEDGRLRMVAPFSPGVRQLAYSYMLPAEHFPLRVPLLDSTGALEVLIEDSAAIARGAGLTQSEAVTVQGKWFRRFVSQKPPPGAVATIEVPVPPAVNRTLYIAIVLVIIGAAMLLALARAGFRRRP